MADPARSIGVVTVARSDYSILYPLLRAIDADPDLELLLYVTGMHLIPEFGHTAGNIERDGFRIEERIDMLVGSDNPAAVSKSIGLGVASFAQIFARRRPDIMVVMGDRYEMFAAAAAALPFGIPLAHIHGGELSEGAIDDAMRHAITKLSHLHFTSTEPYRDRVIQLGEEPWRVIRSGAPALDNLDKFERLDAATLRSRFALTFTEPPLVVTYHPTTLRPTETAREIDALLAALGACGRHIVFTAPNADAGGRYLYDRILAFTAANERADFVANLGRDGYYSLLNQAQAMVGNSSSGIIEAASFKLPVVDIGERQKGRLAPRNVVHAQPDRAAIAAAIEQACSAAFRAGLADLVNPYEARNAVGRIVDTLKKTPLGQTLTQKTFHDVPPAPAAHAAAAR